MEPYGSENLTPANEPAPAARSSYTPDALTREGFAYRINTRTVLWLIVLAVLVAFMTWWALT